MFAVFVTLTFLDFKELGVGLAVAVLIDATIVRGVLLPASMKVLGDWNWYLPKWLEWLPHVHGPEFGRAGETSGATAGIHGGASGSRAGTSVNSARDESG